MLTLLLLGVDRRENDYARSDTIILVNIDPVEKTARMLSIPRDLKVIIPGFGAHKINAAYAFGDANANVPGGGPGLMRRSIETNFGINIDYFAEVDFSGTDAEPSSPPLTFECSLDGATFRPCSPPRTFIGLSAGSHTVRVRASDAAGKRDGSPAVQTFTV